MQKRDPKDIKHDKPVHSYGLWTPKKTVSQIYVCACGNRYLKTRPRQTICVRCMQK